MMILYVNASVREKSRTNRLARKLLSKFDDEIREVRPVEMRFPEATAAFLQKRDALVQKQAFDDPLFDAAREFAAADKIVIAAPFWDLSFPAALKQYFEQINALGVTFVYTETGAPKGLCRAKELYYVTTAGGTIFNEDYGYGYVCALAQNFYGIPKTVLIKAEGLDIVGADVEAILRTAEDEIEKMAP